MCGTLSLLPVGVEHFFGGKAAHAAGDQAQAWHIAFVAMVEEHLLADADAQKGLVAGGFEHRARKPRVSISRMQSGIAPWPGKTTRSAAVTSAGSDETSTWRPSATWASACQTERRLPIP
jgi:hypothetical protein